MSDANQRPPVDAKAAVRISEDRRIAYINVSAPQNGGLPLSEEALKKELERLGVVHGIDEMCMHELLSGAPPYGRQLMIARATMPAKGQDASFSYLFKLSKELRPLELSDGSVDFKNLGIVHNVYKDDPLCEKTPATAGTPGKDVLGGDIPAQTGRDVNLPAGSGTKITEDGLKIVAAMNGQVDIINGRVVVQDTFTVKGDVGVGTGNIDFVGNVVVEGNVSTGFLVKASGSVTVKGMLDGGSVHAGGNVVLLDGFNGMAQGEIKAEGDLKCRYLQNGKVTARGDISVGAIINCDVRCGGTLIVVGAKSQIFSSSLTARIAINCVNVGAPGAARPVTLEAGSDPTLTQRRAENPKELGEATKKLEQINRMMEIFNARAERNLLDEYGKKDHETLRELHRVMMIRVVELVNEKNDIEERTLSVGFGTINITGTAQYGTIIVIGPDRKVLADDHTFTRFTRTAGEGIVISPAK